MFKCIAAIKSRKSLTFYMQLMLLLLLFCAVNNLTDKNKFIALQRKIKTIKHFLYNTMKERIFFFQNAKAINKSENNKFRFKPSANSN